MTVADVIEYAKYGELAQLGVVQNLSSTMPDEVVDAEKQILSYINLGLIELYKRFNLKEISSEVTIIPGTYLYTIADANLNVITSVRKSDGTEYSIGDADDEESVHIIGYNVVKIPTTVVDTTMTVTYSSAPTKLVWVDDLSTVNVLLQPAALETLLHYVGYRAHGAMNGNVDGENNTHYVRFEASCKRLDTTGMMTTAQLYSATKLEDKGFV